MTNTHFPSANRRLLSLLFTVLCCTWTHAAFADSWIDWIKQTPQGPVARIEDSLIYDTVTGRLIMFGGYDLDFNRMHDIWEYNTTTKQWTDVTPPTGTLPSPRSGQTMAFDPVRRKAVLFGGLTDTAQYLGDAWEWDTVNKTWTNVTPGTSPSPRQGARLVYDAANDRMILVGGVDLNNFYNETWAWNLTARTWTKLTLAVSSPTGRPFTARTFPGAAYNSATNRVTLFGGIGFPSPLNSPPTVIDFNDMWELRGNTWTDVTPASGNPPGRGWTQLAFDAPNNRMIMFGGFKVAPPASSYGDTWAFSGGAWTRIVPANAEGDVRDSHGMVYDIARQKVIVFGGYLANVIELTGNTWTTALETVWPPSQDQHAMAYDSDRGVVFLYGGGSPESWELTVATNAWQWYFRNGPDGRTGTTVAYQPGRRKMLLFGGRQRNSQTVGIKLGDTWEWDTTAHTWTNVSPATSPSARDDHAMVYDVAHARAVLFGGRDAGGAALGDTWLWNGTAWTNVTASAAGPSARFGQAMTYDVARGTIVLFGGDNGSQKFNDVWEWDGAAQRWHQIVPANPPPARAYAALSSFDAVAPGVVLFGGLGSSLLADAWIWNGTTWNQANVGSAAPVARQHPVMVYHPGSQRMVLYGGRDARGLSSELWLASISASNTWPAAVSVTPSQGTGASATFTALYRHSGGASQIRDAQFLVNTSAAGANGVNLLYTPATNTLQLRNDNDSGWLTGTVGSSATLANNQVSLNLAAAAAVVSGTDIQLTLPLVFKNAFNGPKNIYLEAENLSGVSPLGWQQKGSFFVSNGNSTPQMVSVSPSTGSGMSQTFTAVYRDVNGVNDLQQTYFLINATIDARRAAFVYYVPAANLLYLRDDNDSTWGVGKAPGSAGTLVNSQVSLDVSHATVSKTATDLTLTLPMSFTPAFVGVKNVYLMAVDFSGARPPLDQLLARFGVGTAAPARPSLPADMVVYHPGNGTWYVKTALSGFVSTLSYQWGLAGDQPIRDDFDGDGHADLVVYRPSDGMWWVKFSSTDFTTLASYQWGLPGDLPVAGDFDGDGKADLVVYRPGDGTWWIKSSSTNFGSYATFQWGLPGDQPLHADFDGDGKSDLVVYRPSTGTWHLRFSSSGYSMGTVASYQWGMAGDVPIPEDFDGDGRSDIVVYRPGDGTWSISFSAGGFTPGNWAMYQWGLRSDLPVLSDFDGDGKAELAVWRPSNGSWSVLYSGSAYSFATWRSFQMGQGGDVLPQDTLSWPSRDVAVYRPAGGAWLVGNGLTGLTTSATYQWGLAGDQPLRADFDGDGRQDLVVYRPSDGTWAVKFSSTGFATYASYQWGLPGDIPVPGDFDGDGRADVAIYRPMNGTWDIRYSSSNYSVGGHSAFQWGLSGDLPLRADFDGDGKADLVVYRPGDGTWWIRSSSTNFSSTAYVSYQLGLSGDLAMPEDFDGDGKSDLVVYRPGDGTWYGRLSSDNYSGATSFAHQWGLNGDLPVLGDFDGDGRADLVVWRPSTGTWYLLSSGSSYSYYRTYQSGQSGDAPLEVR